MWDNSIRKREQRRLLGEWLEDLRKFFKLPPEIILMSFYIFDIANSIKERETDQLQKCILAAFLLSSKFYSHKVHIPFIKELVESCADAYTAKEIREEERQILINELHFKLRPVFPIETQDAFLVYATQLLQQECPEELYTIAYQHLRYNLEYYPHESIQWMVAKAIYLAGADFCTSEYLDHLGYDLKVIAFHQ